MTENRRWLLAARPEGAVKESDFRRDTQPLSTRALQSGEILVRTSIFSCAPTIRNWMNAPGRSYRRSIGIGEPITGVAAGAVVASAHPGYPVGTRVSGVMSWQDYAHLSPDISPAPVLRIDPQMPDEEALGVFGLNTLTGYFGMTEVCAPQAGERVVVSGAAGSTGIVALQVARNLGARVVGIAGGPVKCAKLLALGAEAAIDYKSENIAARLRSLWPEGVNAFFDTTGGPILDAVIDTCAPHARIALCGQIAAYDSDTPAAGPRDMMKVVYGRLRLQGFVTGDYAAMTGTALAQLRAWHSEGRLQVPLDLRDGFDRLPTAFMDLFRGANTGALLVRNMKVSQ